MTRNLKKLLVLVLVLAMAGSMMIVAWASTSQTGEADIEFVGLWEPGIEEPPGDIDPTPPDPPGPDDGEDTTPVDPPGDGSGSPEDPIENPDNSLDPPETLANMDLDFWRHYLPNVLDQNGEINFHSVRARNGQWDNEVTGHDIRENDNRQNGDISLAGIWVRTHDTNWNVTVNIQAFNEGMTGFNMGLMPRGNLYGPIGNGADNDSAVLFRTIPVTGTPLLNAAGDAVEIMSHNPNVVGGDRTFVGGRNFEATLRVPVDNIPINNASPQAQMTWVFNNAAPTG